MLGALRRLSPVLAAPEPRPYSGGIPCPLDLEPSMVLICRREFL